MIAYHFVSDTLRDGRPIPADGEWLEHDGPLVLCESGLHASEHPFDALNYAPGETLCLVECEDVEKEEDGDKLVCRRRKIIARFDATDLMREFARWCALQVIEHWDAPDVVRRYLESGDEWLRAHASAAAWAAARAATWDATWAAARDATWAAARAAASAATWDAARAAASAATWDAARAAAWDAARAAQRDRFKSMVDARFAAMGAK